MENPNSDDNCLKIVITRLSLYVENLINLILKTSAC